MKTAVTLHPSAPFIITYTNTNKATFEYKNKKKYKQKQTLLIASNNSQSSTINRQQVTAISLMFTVVVGIAAMDSNKPQTNPLPQTMAQLHLQHAAFTVL